MDGKKTKFEVIEENRFLKREKMNGITGGNNGLCEAGKYLLCPSMYDTPCAVAVYSVCGEMYEIRPCSASQRTCDYYSTPCYKQNAICVPNIPYNSNCPEMSLLP